MTKLTAKASLLVHKMVFKDKLLIYDYGYLVVPGQILAVSKTKTITIICLIDSLGR